MLDEILYPLMSHYLPAIIFGLAGGFLILSYMKIKKNTYLIMGIGFLYLAIGTVSSYLINGLINFQYMLTYSFLGIRELSPYAWYTIFSILFRLVPAVLIFLGIFRLYRESSLK